MCDCIALLTDFGMADPYAGVVKGVLLSVNPGLKLIDITHEIGPQDVHQAAFVLGESYNFMPPGTIFLAVVDPGVGTSRRGIILEAGGYTFVAPDNGLLTLPMLFEKDWCCVEIRNSDYFLKPVSSTFHARDVFAPVAAYLAAGKALESFGPSVSDPVRLEFPRPKEMDGKIRGEVIYVDRFGNLITNIPRELLERAGGQIVRIKGTSLPFVVTYSDVEPGRAAALVGSSNLLEIAVNQGRAVDLLNAAIGETVDIIPLTSGYL